MDDSSFCLYVLRGQRLAALRGGGNRHAQSCLCFRGSVSFALGESMSKCLAVNAVGYRVKEEKFANNDRDVKSSYSMSIQEQPQYVKLIETPGLRFLLQLLLTPRTMTLVQLHVRL